MAAVFGPAGDLDVVTAHLFECKEHGLFAVSADASGRNLPSEMCADGWSYNTQFALGVHEPVPIPVDPEPILRALRSTGFYVWREGASHGTSQ